MTLNVSAYRCDALVLTTDGLDVVRLPDLRRDEVAAKVAKLGLLLRLADRPGLDDSPTQESIGEILDWLWESAARPVLRHLGLKGPPQRVWWCPTGLLGLLPLHAAGDVLERTVSSYIPTIRALQEARARTSGAVGVTGRLQVVAVTATKGQERLPETAAEALELSARFPGAAPLVDAAATREAVLRALASCTWTHFAGHAETDPHDPSASGLLLHDEPLTIEDIGRLQPGRAELAYLSACSTAKGTPRLADESLHVAAALHACGYASVVGTLWECRDRIARTAASAFYDAFPGVDSATALHRVVTRLRAAHPDKPSRWACWIHAGV